MRGKRQRESRRERAETALRHSRQRDAHAQPADGRRTWRSSRSLPRGILTTFTACVPSWGAAGQEARYTPPYAPAARKSPTCHSAPAAAPSGRPAKVAPGLATVGQNSSGMETSIWKRPPGPMPSGIVASYLRARVGAERGRERGRGGGDL